MSAVLNHSKLETIFDYDLTDEEKLIFAFDLSEAEYIATHDEESINKSLMFLFAMRGDDSKSDFYMKKLDPDFVKLNIKWDSVREAAD